MGTLKRWSALAAVAALVLAACGGGAAEPVGTNGVSTGDGSSGSIEVSGSSTVEPVTALVAERFNQANPGVAISVEGPGTGDGFQRFCAGETDIADASRLIKDAEREACAAAGVDWVELRIAFDGISVITSVDNPEVACLDLGDLYALVGPESEGFATWADADALAAELDAAGLGGRHAPYPDAPLVITAPGEESGTFDAFVELALDEILDARGQSEPTRADYQASANDNVIVDNIASNPTSLGWVGFAFYVENQDVVKAIAVDRGDGDCVEPTIASISDGTYPLARSLYLYVNLAKVAEKPYLADFITFYLEDGITAVAEAGYVLLPEALIAETKATWAEVGG